jgi:hypothetical protein
MKLTVLTIHPATTCSSCYCCSTPFSPSSIYSRTWMRWKYGLPAPRKRALGSLVAFQDAPLDKTDRRRYNSLPPLSSSPDQRSGSSKSEASRHQDICLVLHPRPPCQLQPILPRESRKAAVFVYRLFWVNKACTFSEITALHLLRDCANSFCIIKLMSMPNFQSGRICL